MHQLSVLAKVLGGFVLSGFECVVVNRPHVVTVAQNMAIEMSFRILSSILLKVQRLFFILHLLPNSMNWICCFQFTIDTVLFLTCQFCVCIYLVVRSVPGSKPHCYRRAVSRFNVFQLGFKPARESRQSKLEWKCQCVFRRRRRTTNNKLLGSQCTCRHI